MSASGVEIIYIKKLKRQIENFAKSLCGVSAVEVIKLRSDIFLEYRKLAEDASRIMAIPLQKWPQSYDQVELIKFLSKKISHQNIILPKEFPFFVKLTVDNCESFLQSVWAKVNNKDLVIYLESMEMVIEIQDLESSIAYFESFLSP